MADSKPKVGLLGLTLEFYEDLGTEIREGRERWVRETVLPALAQVADVSFPGALFRREEIQRVVDAFEAEDVDVLVVILLTYATSLSSLPALQRTRLPILVWNTQELYAVDERYDVGDLIGNHGVHGTFDLCNVLVRAGVRFGYVTSHLNDTDCMGTLARRLRAAAAVARLQRMRIGLLGWPFPGMGDFGVDTTHLAATLGCTVEPLPLAEYQDRADGADPDAIRELVDAYNSEYDVAPDVTAKDLAMTARAELALRAMVADYRLDAYTYQFLAFGKDPRTDTLPFVAASRLMADGIGFGGEGDVISAAFTAVMNRIAPPASFSEIFTVDFAGNGLLLSHMGEANVAMARGDRRPPLRRREPIVPIRGTQLAIPVAFEPGEATLAAFTLGPESRWRIISSAVDIADFTPLDHLGTPNTKILPRRDVRDWLNDYAMAGGPHHLAVGAGDAREELRLLARLIDADFVEI